MTNAPFRLLQKAKFKCNLLRRLGKSGQDLGKSAGAGRRARFRCWLHPPLSLHPDPLPRLLGSACTDIQMPSSFIQVPSTSSSPANSCPWPHLQGGEYIVMEACACSRTVRVIPKVPWYLGHWLEGKSDHCVGTSYWLQGFSHHGLGPGQRRTRAISPKGWAQGKSPSCPYLRVIQSALCSTGYERKKANTTQHKKMSSF